MKRLGTPVHSKKFYQNILQEYSKDTSLFGAKISGQTISAMLTINFKQKFDVITSDSLWSHRHMKPNALLYWQVVQFAVGHRCKTIDFGGSTWESGTFKFKKHLGACPAPFYYDYYLNTRKTMPHINQENKSYRFVCWFWQHLPITHDHSFRTSLIKYIL